MASRAGPSLADGLALGAVLDDFAVAWPWPYSQTQLDQIEKCLKQFQAPLQATVAVVMAARFYVGMDTARRGLGNENPHTEIVRLAAAIDELVSSLEGLGAEARLHLQVSDLAKEFPTLQWRLLREAYALQSNPGLQAPPAPHDTRGAPVKRPLDWLLLRLHSIVEPFVAANGGRGFPAFRNACLEPLGLKADESTQQDRLQTAKQRHSIGRNN